jgi:hypothetical protein
MPLHNVPMLVETDSRMGYRNLVHFHHPTDAKTLDVLNIRGNAAGYIPMIDAEPLFNCDDDPRTMVSRKVTTVSRAVAADRVVTAEVADMLLTLQGQDIPTDDDILTSGGAGSNSDAEFGGTVIMLQSTTPRLRI